MLKQSSHFNTGIAYRARQRTVTYKCQKRNKETADTGEPLLGSCILHDHITVCALVSK